MADSDAPARPYRSTPPFTHERVPAALLRDHSVRAGARGELVVEEGSLVLVFPGPPERRQRCAPGVPGALPPELPHRVELAGPVRFRVDFYRL